MIEEGSKENKRIKSKDKERGNKRRAGISG